MGKGEEVLDWRASDSGVNEDESPITQFHDENRTSYAEDTARPRSGDVKIVFVPVELSAEDYSALWDTLDTALASEYELSASSALNIEDMLTVIMEHLQNNGFGIAASGVVSSTLTVFSYASCEAQQRKRRGPDTCLVELKLRQLNEAVNNGGKLTWQLEFTCKCTDTKIAAQFLQSMKLHLLLGSEEIVF